MKNLAVANASGSAGKTTGVVSLATLSATEHDKKVLIGDVDPQGNASSWLGLKGVRPNMADVLLNPRRITEAIYPVVIDGTEIPNLFVVPSDRSLTEALYELDRKPKRDERLAQACRLIAHIFDEFWGDCNGDLNLATINELIAADSVVTAAKPAEKEIEGFVDLQAVVNEIAELNGSDLSIDALIPSDVFSRHSGKAYFEGLKLLKSQHPDIVTEPVPHAVTQVEAYSRQVPLPLYVPDGDVTNAYRKIRKQFVERGILTG